MGDKHDDKCAKYILPFFTGVHILNKNVSSKSPYITIIRTQHLNGDNADAYSSAPFE